MQLWHFYPFPTFFIPSHHLLLSITLAAKMHPFEPLSSTRYTLPMSSLPRRRSIKLKVEPHDLTCWITSKHRSDVVVWGLVDGEAMLEDVHSEPKLVQLFISLVVAVVLQLRLFKVSASSSVGGCITAGVEEDSGSRGEK